MEIQLQYIEAFKKALQVDEGESFEIKPMGIEGYNVIYVIYKEKTYSVNSYDDLLLYAKESLEDRDMAKVLSPSSIANIMEYIHVDERFKYEMKNVLKKKQFHKLSICLMQDQIIGEEFWWALYKSDDDLYGKVIIATAKKFYNIEILREELVEHITRFGQHLLCEIRDGLFETVYMNEDNPDDAPFYVFQIDDF